MSPRDRIVEGVRKLLEEHTSSQLARANLLSAELNG